MTFDSERDHVPCVNDLVGDAAGQLPALEARCFDVLARLDGLIIAGCETCQVRSLPS